MNKLDLKVIESVCMLRANQVPFKQIASDLKISLNQALHAAKLGGAVKNKLTKDQINSIICDYELGISIKDIASKFKINKSTISSIIRKEGITKRQEKINISEEVKLAILEARRLGTPAQEISDKFNIKISAISHLCRANGVILSEQQRKVNTKRSLSLQKQSELLLDRAAGTSRRSLAKKYGINTSTVKSILLRARLVLTKEQQIKNLIDGCNQSLLNRLPKQHDVSDFDSLMVKYANRNNGTVLDSYNGCYSKLKWKCEEGHIFSMTPNSVQQGQWCPKCSKFYGNTTRLKIEDCHALAKIRNGKFLSTNYTNSKTKYEWQCENNHSWEATYSAVKQNHWCRKCYDSKNSLDSSLLRDFVEQKGGNFLSDRYINIRTRYKFQCEIGHTWETSAHHVLNQNTWCPHCPYGLKGQNELAEFCRTINSNFIENSRPFPKPNHRLQLDIYYPELKKAIELDGKYWHSMPGGPERDARKDKLCEELNIQLLRIDYISQWYFRKRIIGQDLIQDFLNP